MLRQRIKEEIVKNRQRIRNLGPELITGGAGDDPAGTVTYTVVGATTGFTQLWLLLLSTPMMIAIQNAVARITIVTGKSLPEVTTAFYSKKLTVLMVMVLAIANIPTTALIVYLILFGKYKMIRNVLIALTAVLGVLQSWYCCGGTSSYSRAGRIDRLCHSRLICHDKNLSKVGA